MVLLNEFPAILDNGERSKAQEVELEKSDALDIGLCKLNDRGIVIDRERSDVSDVRSRDYHSRGMRTGIPREAFYPHSHIDDLMCFGVSVITFPELRTDFERLSQCHSHGKRDHLGYLIALGDRHIKYSRDILHRLSGGKGSESNHVRHPALTVFGGNVIYCYLPSLIVEVDVEVRHRYTLYIKESLEDKTVPDGIDIRNAYRIRHERTCARASSGTYRDIVGL